MTWPVEFAAAFARKRLLGRDTPLLAGYKLTHECNLRCAHCPFWSKPWGMPSLDLVEKTLDRLRRMGVLMVIFEGGEPFLWKDGAHGLEDVVRRASRRFPSVGVTTNGTLPIETSARTVWVSLDGLRENHDRVRGKGAFDRTMARIEASSHRGIHANMTVNSLNAPDVEPLIRFLDGHVRGFTFQFHYPFGGRRRDLVLSRVLKAEVCRKLVSLKREGLPVSDSYAAIEALGAGKWRCHDFLVASVEPDGTVRTGCYVRGRGGEGCAHCGFAAHAEISLAFDLNPGAIMAGWKLFGWPAALW